MLQVDFSAEAFLIQVCIVILKTIRCLVFLRWFSLEILYLKSVITTFAGPNQRQEGLYKFPTRNLAPTFQVLLGMISQGTWSALQVSPEQISCGYVEVSFSSANSKSPLVHIDKKFTQAQAKQTVRL